MPGVHGAMSGLAHVAKGTRSRGHSVSSTKDDSRRSSVEDVAKTSDDETVVDDGEKNILLSIISQLRPGADLSRITLPTFILEPRSMLDRITNFMQHPETLLPMPYIDDPTERFISVVKFYLSGWHIKPPGVKKPLNPILGEFFTCSWDLDTNGQAYYIAEQTSHHPPKSSYFYMAPQHHIRIDGTLKPKSRFLGNSAASMMEGIAFLKFLNRPLPNGGYEKYALTQPNMYVRGILFGKMKFELGDHSYVRCPALDLVADIEFKVKGYIMGGYNAIGGHIKRESTGELLYEFSGKWNEEMYIKNLATGERTLLFDATTAKHTPPNVRPIAEQEDRESHRLWQPVVKALLAQDQQTATDEKFKIEERQRDEARMRENDGVEFRPRFFREVRPGEEDEDLDYIIATNIDGKTPEEQIKQILAIAPILPGSHPRYNIPEYHSHEPEEDARGTNSSDASSKPTENIENRPQVEHKSSIGTEEDELLGSLGSKATLDGAPTLVPTSNGVSVAGRASGLSSMSDVGTALPAVSRKTNSGQGTAGPKKVVLNASDSDSGDDNFMDAE